MKQAHTPARVCIISLGCAKNLVDSESMAALLERAGYRLVTDPDRADAVLVNTCGFIAPAREESLAVIRQVRGRDRQRVLVAAGCLAQRIPEELARAGVDAVVGTGELERLPEVLAACLRTPGRRAADRGAGDAGARSARAVGVWVGRPEVPLGLPRRLSTGVTAYLKIAEGCDRRCTFCIIPRLRGRYRSRPVEELVEEARGLVEQGARELVLVAEDTSRYGQDLYGQATLPRLLKALAAVDGVAWIRVLYAYPAGFPLEAARLMADEAKVLPYLDLPLQHISDHVLSRMGRPYRGDDVRRLLDRLRAMVPGIVLRSTFLVGFPGETEEDFGQLVEFLRQYRLERAGFFPFYPEPEAPAARFPGQVPEEVKKRRLEEVQAVQQEIAVAANRRLLGREVEVLVELRARARTLSGRREKCGRMSAWGGQGDTQRRAGLPVAVGRWAGQAPEVDGQVHVIGSEAAPGQFVLAEVQEVRDSDLVAVASGASARD
ncbi:MAG: 30S ribosomal protein S12 methylthiotransferase RimO [Bacillota bacterium]